MKKEQIVLLTINIFYNSKHVGIFFSWPFYEPSFISLVVITSKRQMSDSGFWHLIKNLAYWIQPFNDSLKFYFDNLFANPACRSIFSFLAKCWNFSKKIALVKWRENLVWRTLVCSIPLALIFFFFFTQNMQNSDIWKKSL